MEQGLLHACTPLAERHLVACIQDSLSQYLYENAKWLAERLVALSSAEPNVFLLATCYFHCNQAYRSYHLLKSTGAGAPQSRYLLAQCCIQLGRLHEAKEALTNNSSTQQVPGGPAGLYLLGKVCRLSGSNQEAREHYLQALRQNPLLWCAFEELCSLGADDEAREVCSKAAACQASLGQLLAQQQQSEQEAATHAHEPEQPQPLSPTTAAAQKAARPGKGSNKQATHTAGIASAPADSVHTPSTTGQYRPANCNKNLFVFGSGGSQQGCNTANISKQGIAMPWPNSAGLGLQPAAINWDASSPFPAGPSFATPASSANGSAAWQSEHTPSIASSGGMGTPYWPGLGVLAMDTSQPAAAQQQPAAGDSAGGVSSMTGLVGPGVNMADNAAAALGSGPAQGPGVPYTTPGFVPTMAAPPPPPRKPHGGSEGSFVFPVFTGPFGNSVAVPTPMSAGTTTTPTGSYGQQGQQQPQPSNPPPQHHVQRETRMALEDGKVRKVSGKSLFHMDTGEGADRGRSTGSHAPRPHGVSPSRRSSRLAALQGGGHTGRNNARGTSSKQYQHQNQPDQSTPMTATLSYQQPVADAKLAVTSDISAQQRQPSGKHQRPEPLTKLGAMQQGQGAPTSLPLHPMQLYHVTPQTQASALAVLCYAYEGYRHMSMYRNAEALAAFQKLPPTQYRTAWVFCNMGKLLMERLEYGQAAAAFEAALQLDRQRVEGMELYSTVLWHLKRDTDLSFLAQTAVAIDRLAPQSWCVLGNLFSLQREHAMALKLFERALQIDPACTYAYTLSGHEYVASEELDKALTCYRNALRIDPRHYNAMYGMGSVYFRQEKYDVALCHFRSAALVCPSSSVLHCYMGMALCRQGAADKALQKLQQAIELDPRNPLARYEKASLLAGQGDIEGALAEYKVLAHLAPGEASVYLQMGKLFKRLGQLQAAQHQLELALSFNTSSGDAATIKSAIDKLHLTEEEQQEEL